jgi:hypothetical protein
VIEMTVLETPPNDLIERPADRPAAPTADALPNDWWMPSASHFVALGHLPRASERERA